MSRSVFLSWKWFSADAPAAINKTPNNVMNSRVSNRPETTTYPVKVVKVMDADTITFANERISLKVDGLEPTIKIIF
ncbi:hypothetical protein [Williamwhitmania taraxaci]|uniref:hypothetical protein n=1 Tax=Williamwhitmania taraxaci TaxID=1640674 RepID=UPI001FCD5026|nr:hypothetical protein [Williamwhitmania taraxaci]